MNLLPRPSYDLRQSMATFDDHVKPYEQTYQYVATIPPAPPFDPERTMLPSGVELRQGSVKMWKTREDLERYRAICAESRPEVLIETGTRWGGSAAWFRNHLQIPHVFSIDVSPVSPKVREDFPDITFIRGDSSNLAVRAEVESQVIGKRVMVVLDSDHHADHVYRELDLWAPLVTPGCYLAVEDAIFDVMPVDEARRGGHAIPEVGGPLRAMQEWGLAGHMFWERATRIEDMSPISHHPAGFWKRTHVDGWGKPDA